MFVFQGRSRSSTLVPQKNVAPPRFLRHWKKIGVQNIGLFYSDTRHKIRRQASTQFWPAAPRWGRIRLAPEVLRPCRTHRKSALLEYYFRRRRTQVAGTPRLGDSAIWWRHRSTPVTSATTTQLADT